MADDPVAWLADHIAAGIIIREECWSLRTAASVEAWTVREKQWADALRRGVQARNPRDVARVDLVNTIRPLDLPAGHPWADPPAHGMTVSSTGEGRFGCNPASCHAARIEKPRSGERGLASSRVRVRYLTLQISSTW